MKKFFPYILILFLFLPTLSLEFPVVLPKSAHAAVLIKAPNNLGLVGYWSMNEGKGTKVGDSSGNGNIGTITGATWTDGKYGKGVNFANTGYVNVGNPASFRIATKTISFWAKPTATETYDMIFSNQSGNYYVTFSSGNNLFVSYVDATPAQRAFVLASGVVSVGTWAHYTVIFQVSGSNVTISAYKNGSFVNSVTHTDGYSTGYGSNFLIGALTTTNSSFQGALDDVRVYNRALTPSQVTALYSSGAVKRTGVSNQGLVGYWSFNDSAGTKAGDSSGNGNTGTLTLMDPATDWVAGKRGKALDFDGSNDYVYRATFNNVPSSYMTLSAWVKTSVAKSQLVVAQGRRPATVDGEYLYSIEADGKQLFWDYNGGYGYAETGTSSTSILDGNWHHITFVKNGTSGIYYLDGQADGTKTAAANKSYITDDFVIGENYRSGNQVFNGLIDDVRVYNRVLSPTEVSTLYHQGEATINSSQNTKLTSGLVGLWSFNGLDISGTTAYDRSGSSPANNGVITGATKTIGKVGQAMVFNGSSDFVAVPTTPTSVLNISGNQITESAWIFPTSYSANSTIATRTGGYYFQLHSNGTLAAYQYGTSPAGYHYSTGVVPLNLWSHVAYSYNGSKLIFYINGVASGSPVDKTGNVTQLGGYENEPFRIGWDSSVGTRYFKGKIDEARIYNRALTAAEVQQLYNMGK